MHWYIDVLKKYAVFTGRAQRQEYWMFLTVHVVISCVLALLEVMLGLSQKLGEGWLSILYALAVILPNIGVGIRRLHDTDRSGWWLLLNLIPCIGFIITLVFFIQDSDSGDNQYGPNPKGQKSQPGESD